MDHHPIDWYWALRGFAAGLAMWALWVGTRDRFFTDYDALADVFEDDDQQAGDVGDRYRATTFRRSPRSW